MNVSPGRRKEDGRLPELAAAAAPRVATARQVFLLINEDADSLSMEFILNIYFLNYNLIYKKLRI